MNDFRCFSAHFYYKLTDEDGESFYSTLMLAEAVNINEIITLEGYMASAERMKEALAEMTDIPFDNIEVISRDEYKANADEDGNEAVDFDIIRNNQDE